MPVQARRHVCKSIKEQPKKQPSNDEKTFSNDALPDSDGGIDECTEH